MLTVARLGFPAVDPSCRESYESLMLSPIARPYRSLVVLLPVALLAIAGCTSESEGRPDSELGNLVISPSTAVATVEIEAAARDADALLAAVQLPHTWLAESLGAHVLQGSSSVEVHQGGEVVDEVRDTLRIDFDGESRFAATLDTHNDYGRHAIFDGTNLYLRPRFGLYHKRAPQTETEAEDIRTEMAFATGDYVALLGRGLEVTDRGAKTRDGRAVRQIGLKLAPKPRKVPPETLVQKQWRESIVVKTLSGQVDLDIESGAPIYISIDGSIVFERDGQSFQMFVKATRSIGEIGHTRAISAPPTEEAMSIPARRRELDERNTLLRNIAPPARRSPTPEAKRGTP